MKYNKIATVIDSRFNMIMSDSFRTISSFTLPQSID